MIFYLAVATLIFMASPISGAAQPGQEQRVTRSVWWQENSNHVLHTLADKGTKLVTRIASEPDLDRKVAFYSDIEETEKEMLIRKYFLEIEGNIQAFSAPLIEKLQTIEPCCKKWPTINCSWSTSTAGIMIMYVHKASARHCTLEECQLANKATFPQTINQLESLLPGHEDKKLALFSALVSLYKIHLMPHDSDMVLVLNILFDTIAQDDQLRKSISRIKIKPVPEQLIAIMQQLDSTSETNFPKIVIYAYGKEYAQYALNSLYAVLKNIPGNNRAPSFNKKITDLIFFAQGNRDEKVDYPEWFTQDKIYFNADFLNKKIGAPYFSQQNFNLLLPPP